MTSREKLIKAMAARMRTDNRCGPSDAEDFADDALTAITDAGYAVVPITMTEAMVDVTRTAEGSSKDIWPLVVAAGRVDLSTGDANG